MTFNPRERKMSWINIGDALYLAGALLIACLRVYVGWCCITEPN